MRPRLAAILAGAAMLLGAASATAHEGGTYHGALGLPLYEGDWAWSSFVSFEWAHDARGSGEIRVEETAPNAVKFTALTPLTVTNWDGSTCRIADTQATLADMTFQPNGAWIGSAALGSAVPLDSDPENRLRCTGSTSAPSVWEGAHIVPLESRPQGSDGPYLLGTTTFQQRLRFPTVPYVALGDSYSSGEGAGQYDKDAGRCHRSRNAWPRLLAKISRREPIEEQPHLEMKSLLACSGAETPEVMRTSQFGQPPQIDVLERLQPRFVTLTIGGNDAGFAPTLRDCFTPGECLTKHKPKRRKGRPDPKSKYERAMQAINRLENRLPGIYRTIASKLVDPERLVVVGYPDLIPRGDDRCAWLSDREKRRLGHVADRLELALEATTKEADVRYISLAGTTEGHEMCTKDSWFVTITLRRVVSRMVAKLARRHRLQELGHPRYSGQRAIAQRVAQQLGLR